MGRHGQRQGNGKNGECKAQNPELMADEWIESAEHDLRVATTLFNAGHYNWAAFVCQQSIEKLLKAGYVRSRKKIPPHVHKLQRLTAIMKLEPPESYLDDLIDIDECYTTTRYPGYKNSGCSNTRHDAEEILRKTWKMYRWIREELRL